MPGKRYLLDTNALVALLQGNQELLDVCESADWLGVSVINVLEFLGFEGLEDADRQLLTDFLARVNVVDVSYGQQDLMRHIAELRQRKTLKLPDAIVMASAAANQATLVTNDAQLLKLAMAEAKYSAMGFGWP